MGLLTGIGKVLGGASGAKLRLATYGAEVIYNPGMAEGWKRGWS